MMLARAGGASPFLKYGCIRLATTPLRSATPNRRFRRGVTLPEALMAVGVFAAMVAVVAYIASLVMASVRSTQLTSEITTLEDTINQTTQGTTDLSNLSSAAVAQSGMLPNRYVDANGGTTIYSPFGGTITITGTGPGGGTDGLTTYLLNIPQLTRAACVKVMTMDFGNSLVSRTPAGDGVNGGPSSLLAATSQCSSPSNNTIKLEFTRS